MYAHEAQLHARDQFRQIASAPEDPPLDQMLIWLSIEEQPLEEGSESGELKTPEVALAQLDALAEGLHLPAEASIFERIARLNHRLFQDLGFRGDSDGYDHPRNSILHQVLARRQGLPILLSAVYMEVARRAGLVIQGVGYPGHFLVTPADAEPRFFVDPFHAGEILTEARLLNRARQMGFPEPASTLEPVDHRAILIRVNNNLKGSHLRRENLPGALRAIDRLLALRPSLHGERRDRGLILAHIGRPLEAARDLEAYLQARPDAPDAWPIQERLQALNRTLQDL